MMKKSHFNYFSEHIQNGEYIEYLLSRWPKTFLFCYHFWICSDNRRFQATNPNAASGDHGQQPQQQQQHTNGVLLNASRKDLESKYLNMN